MHLAEGEGGGSGSVDGGPGGVGALKGAGALKGGPEARAGANTVCSVPCLSSSAVASSISDSNLHGADCDGGTQTLIARSLSDLDDESGQLDLAHVPAYS